MALKDNTPDRWWHSPIFHVGSALLLMLCIVWVPSWISGEAPRDPLENLILRNHARGLERADIERRKVEALEAISQELKTERRR